MFVCHKCSEDHAMELVALGLYDQDSDTGYCGICSTGEQSHGRLYLRHSKIESIVWKSVRWNHG